MGRRTSSAPWNESSAGMSPPPWGPAGLKANLERLEKVWVVNVQNTWMGVGKMTKSYEEVGDVGGSELRKNNEVVVGLDVPTLESSVPLEMRGVGRYLFEQILLRCNNSLQWETIQLETIQSEVCGYSWIVAWIVAVHVLKKK